MWFSQSEKWQCSMIQSTKAYYDSSECEVQTALLQHAKCVIVLGVQQCVWSSLLLVHESGIWCVLKWCGNSAHSAHCWLAPTEKKKAHNYFGFNGDLTKESNIILCCVFNETVKTNPKLFNGYLSIMSGVLKPIQLICKIALMPQSHASVWVLRLFWVIWARGGF